MIILSRYCNQTIDKVVFPQHDIDIQCHLLCICSTTLPDCMHDYPPIRQFLQKSQPYNKCVSQKIINRRTASYLFSSTFIIQVGLTCCIVSLSALIMNMVATTLQFVLMFSIRQSKITLESSTRIYKRKNLHSTSYIYITLKNYFRKSIFRFQNNTCAKWKVNMTLGYANSSSKYTLGEPPF